MWLRMLLSELDMDYRARARLGKQVEVKVKEGTWKWNISSLSCELTI